MASRLLLLALIAGSIAPEAFGYEPFPVDMSPFAKHPKLASEWEELKSNLKKESPQRETQLKRQLELVESLAKEESAWVDIQWIVADAAFQLGSFYQKPKDLPFARSVFVRGQKSVEKCLKRSKDHVICKLLLGAMIGKIGSIDGIFATLRKAQQVEQLWLDVTKSRYDYRMSEHSTVQGAARYALGMFYRLVPNVALLEWVFGVRGNIEKSVNYHRESLEADGPNVCNSMMLGVALVCAGKSDKTPERKDEGIALLKDAQKLTANSTLAKTCADDIPALLADNSLACGYESSRQQDQDEKNIPSK